MTTIMAFIKRHAVATYFFLVFVISWGSMLLLIGPGVFVGTKQISFVGEGPIAFLAFLAGPSVSGVLLTGLIYGRPGLHDLRSRLLRWRVGIRWYAVALFTAPLLITLILFALSFTSPVFLPAFTTMGEKTRPLLFGIAVGLVVAFFEELGWTGFATPELRKRYDILATGLILGMMWGLWHLPLFTGVASSSTVIPPWLYLAALLFSWLVPYRVLMVWVHDRTKSLLLVMLMHLPLIINQFVLLPAGMAGVPVMVYDLVLAVSLWVLVAAVALTDGWRISRQTLRRSAA